jgi:hypothetical protein
MPIVPMNIGVFWETLDVGKKSKASALPTKIIKMGVHVTVLGVYQGDQCKLYAEITTS